MILQAFAQLPEEKLVLVGNWSRSEFGKRMKTEYSAYKNIMMLNPIYDALEINLLRSNCKIYIHGHSAGGTNPSLVEAMNLHLPIITYGVVYNRETTENRALYFEDAESLIYCIRSLGKKTKSSGRCDVCNCSAPILVEYYMYEIRTLIFMRTRVLLLDGHTIQVLPFLKAYAALNVEVTIFCENKLSYGYFSRYNKHTVICPPIAENVIAYKTFLLDYIVKYPQDMVIPLFNDTAEFASKFKQEIEQYGCKVEIPDWEVFIKGHDKESLMEICKFLGVPHPRTANPDKMGYEEAINYVGYPCLIKPNLSAGAKGIKIIRNKADFDNYFRDITSHFGKSTIQEFIPQTGKQLKVQIYRAENGQVVASSCYEKCRYYPIDGGTSTCNKVVKRDDLVVRYSKSLII